MSVEKPSQVSTRADLHALVDDLDPINGVDLAMRLLARETDECFVVVMRQGEAYDYYGTVAESNLRATAKRWLEAAPTFTEER